MGGYVKISIMTDFQKKIKQFREKESIKSTVKSLFDKLVNLNKSIKMLIRPKLGEQVKPQLHFLGI